MLVLTDRHFRFADQLTRDTIIFQQSLVIHSCMHIGREISTFKNTSPEMIWMRILAGTQAGFLDEAFSLLLFEMVRHAAMLHVHDHPNPIIGTFKGAYSMIRSERETVALMEQKKLQIPNDAVECWIMLLIDARLDANTARARVVHWVSQYASPL
jgi:hypothetical protein